MKLIATKIMLSSETIAYIQEILTRLSNGKSVTLEERLYIQKASDQDQKVRSWLKRAKRLQIGKPSKSYIDNLINELDLGPIDDDVLAKPTPDDLGHWFTGAPSWVARS